ncbi:MAG: hydrogenase expression/formation protein HypE [Magnetococcales bacterium]|nr:hydrogenase expression/formation protein HypE [Magnetococcales bacterium]
MNDDRILLGHGSGGRLSRQLIAEEIIPRFGAGPLKGLPDAAALELATPRIRFTTDSFVVHPLEFPGGNIGDLAVHGTVNDLAVAGAIPRWLGLGLILEEGLPLATLRRVLDAVKRAADACGVIVATGDTKVVQRGQCDGLYINSSGIGEAIPELALARERIAVGDHLLVSGTLGDHGAAVLAAREGFAIDQGPVSDSRPVHRLVQAIAPLGQAIRFMRDPTRGGLAATLNELVDEQKIGIQVQENDLPFAPATRALAEMLGLDLLHAPSEGCLLLVCAPEVTAMILDRWHALPEGVNARHIGRVSDQAGRVILTTAIGGQRIIDLPGGELLPRIC